MVEVTGNLWLYPAEVRVITTNGFVKQNGEAVMGRGCAAEAKALFPTLPKVLGQHITHKGNVVSWLYGDEKGKILFSFPVKHHWYQQADIKLIEKSAQDISRMIPNWIKVVVMPRPGCGNGRLQWPDVKEVIAPILDDRFHVITFR